MSKQKKQGKGTTLHLSEFLGTASAGGGGSWADEVSDLPTASSGLGSSGAGIADSSRPSDGAWGAGRETVPLPTAPPYKAFLGNLSFECGERDISLLFRDLMVKAIILLKDPGSGKPKGLGFVEFDDLESLKQALTLTGSSVQGRNIRISVASARASDDPSASRPGDATNWRSGGSSFGGAETTTRRPGFDTFDRSMFGTASTSIAPARGAPSSRAPMSQSASVSSYDGGFDRSRFGSAAPAMAEGRRPSHPPAMMAQDFDRSKFGSKQGEYVERKPAYGRPAAGPELDRTKFGTAQYQASSAEDYRRQSSSSSTPHDFDPSKFGTAPSFTSSDRAPRSASPDFDRSKFGTATVEISRRSAPEAAKGIHSASSTIDLDRSKWGSVKIEAKHAPAEAALSSEPSTQPATTAPMRKPAYGREAWGSGDCNRSSESFDRSKWGTTDVARKPAYGDREASQSLEDSFNRGGHKQSRGHNRPPSERSARGGHRGGHHEDRVEFDRSKFGTVHYESPQPAPSTDSEDTKNDAPGAKMLLAKQTLTASAVSVDMVDASTDKLSIHSAPAKPAAGGKSKWGNSGSEGERPAWKTAAVAATTSKPTTTGSGYAKAAQHGNLSVKQQHGISKNASSHHHDKKAAMSDRVAAKGLVVAAAAAASSTARKAPIVPAKQAEGLSSPPSSTQVRNAFELLGDEE